MLTLCQNSGGKFIQTLKIERRSENLSPISYAFQAAVHVGVDLTDTRC